MTNDRLVWHEMAAEERDARFTGWNNRKVDQWRADVGRWRQGPLDDETRILLVASRWISCACGRMFQPGEKNYARCYTCSNASWAEGSTACAICQRRHSTKFACCKFCTTNGLEDTATLLRSVVMRRDGYKCNICNETDGQLDIHHILPDGSAWAWNLEIACVSCWITMNASKAVGPADELAWLERALAYDSYLDPFLDDLERTTLREQLRERLGSDFRAHAPKRPYDTGECDPIVGLLNVLDSFGREGITVEHLETT